LARLRKVKAFLDWDTVRRLVPPRARPVQHIEQVILHVQDAIARRIEATEDVQDTYRVSWRVYHGWYQGKTKTEDRRNFELFPYSARARTVGRVSFSTDFAFSEMLCCGGFRNPLFDTLRHDDKSGESRQKMVDTALASDLLHLVRSKFSCAMPVLLRVGVMR
jgi:hypothetical protein